MVKKLKNIVLKIWVNRLCWLKNMWTCQNYAFMQYKKKSAYTSYICF